MSREREEDLRAALVQERIQAKFRLGHVVITPGALERLNQGIVVASLRRHAAGDWGELDPEDRETNEWSLKRGGRLFSAYKEGERSFWIITESDRSVTTILLPEEY